MEKEKETVKKGHEAELKEIEMRVKADMEALMAAKD